ncbi:MAG: hypothetical protein ABJN14_01780 [Paracoccaceae bacterium]
MSYDLMVFDPEVAPQDRDSFMEWYEDVAQWDEPRDYDVSDGMTGNLKSFFDLIRQVFPPLNGPHAAPIENVDDPEVTEYVLAGSAIYMAFAWSISKTARATVIHAAIETSVGFFDVSSEEGVIARDQADLLALKE